MSHPPARHPRRPRHARTTAALLLAATAAAAATLPAAAVSRQWVGAAGSAGAFNDPAKWSPSGAPGPADALTIFVGNSDTTETVTLTADASAASLSILNGALVQTGAFDLTLSGAFAANGANTRLRPQTGGSATASQFELINGATIEMAGGTLTTPGKISVTLGAITGFGTITAGGDIRVPDGGVAASGGTLTLRATGGAKIDLDGVNQDGAVTVTQGSSDLVVDGPLANAFYGTISVGNNNSISFSNDWLTAPGSTLSLAGSFGAATLGGAGLGQLYGNVPMSGSVRFDAPVEFGSGSNPTIAAGSAVSFNTAATLRGTFSSPSSYVSLNAAASILGGTFTLATFDLDGTESATGHTHVIAGAVTVNTDAVEQTANDGFDETLHLKNASLTVNTPAPWRLDGTLRFDTQIAGGASTLAGSGVVVHGQVEVVAGAVGQFNSPSDFHPTAAVSVPAGATLRLGGATTFRGGSFTGAGTIVQQADATVAATTTIDVAYYDWDGGTGAHTTLNPGTTFTVNVQQLGPINNVYSGHLAVNDATLAVNTPNPWTMAGTMTVTNLPGGALPIIQGSPLVLNGPLTTDGTVFVNTLLRYTANAALTVASGTTTLFQGLASSVANRTLTKLGPGTLTVAGAHAHLAGSKLSIQAGEVLLQSDAGDGGANLTVEILGPGSIATFQTAQRLKSLSVDAGLARMTGSGPARVLVAQSLLTANGGRIDLADAAAIVDHAPAAPQTAAVRAAIVAAYANGLWTGGGITSSVAAAGNGSTTLGYADATDVLPFNNGATTFRGQPVDTSAVLVRYTLFGDATLDGLVDFNDLVKLAQNYETTVSATTESWWSRGDFTYDGVVDFNDLVKLAQNYDGALAGAATAGASAAFQGDLAAAFASVPEPAAALVLVGLSGLCRRRR